MQVTYSMPIVIIPSFHISICHDNFNMCDSPCANDFLNHLVWCYPFPHFTLTICIFAYPRTNQSIIHEPTSLLNYYPNNQMIYLWYQEVQGDLQIEKISMIETQLFSIHCACLIKAFAVHTQVEGKSFFSYCTTLKGILTWGCTYSFLSSLSSSI